MSKIGTLPKKPSPLNPIRDKASTQTSSSSARNIKEESIKTIQKNIAARQVAKKNINNHQKYTSTITRAIKALLPQAAREDKQKLQQALQKSHLTSIKEIIQFTNSILENRDLLGLVEQATSQERTEIICALLYAKITSEEAVGTFTKGLKNYKKFIPKAEINLITYHTIILGFSIGGIKNYEQMSAFHQALNKQSELFGLTSIKHYSIMFLAFAQSGDNSTEAIDAFAQKAAPYIQDVHKNRDRLYLASDLAAHQLLHDDKKDLLATICLQNTPLPQRRTLLLKAIIEGEFTNLEKLKLLNKIIPKSAKSSHKYQIIRHLTQSGLNQLESLKFLNRLYPKGITLTTINQVIKHAQNDKSQDPILKKVKRALKHYSKAQ